MKRLTILALAGLLTMAATANADHCRVNRFGFGRGSYGYGHRQVVFAAPVYQPVYQAPVVVQLPAPVYQIAPPVVVQAAPVVSYAAPPVVNYGAPLVTADPGHCSSFALSSNYGGYPQLLSAGYAFSAGTHGVGYYGHGQFFGASRIHGRGGVVRGEVARALALARALRGRR